MAGLLELVVMTVSPARAGSGRPGRSHPRWGGQTGDRGGDRVGDDAAVEHLDAPPRPGGDRMVVGDDDDRGPGGVQLFQQAQDGGAGGRVQIPGRLISQHHRRGTRHRAGDRDPLPFPSRQLARPVGSPVRQPHPVQGLQRQPPPPAAPDPGIEQPVRHVAQHALVLGQMELLEHEPDPPGPQRGQLPVRQRGRVQAGDAHCPGRRLVQGAHQVQQRGLARPRRAGHRYQLAGRHRQAHPIQRPHRRPARIHLDHLIQLQHRRRAAAGPGRQDRLRAGGHDAATTTRCPGVSAPLTCTSPEASSKSPGRTGTYRRVPPAPTTSTT